MLQPQSGNFIVRPPRLKVFENRVLRRMFGPKGDEIIRGWRTFHNEELRNLYDSSPE
jgi:hypothetical protein